jgi:hypothetical protein
VDKLVRAKIRDLDSLCLLSQYDVTALKLEIGDRGKFRRALRKLRKQYPDDDDDALNTSTSSKIDDSFDANDPEQLALQQRLQFDSLKKLKTDQDALAREQSRLQSSQGASKSSQLLSQVPSQLASAVSPPSLEQLSTLLSPYICPWFLVDKSSQWCLLLKAWSTSSQ